MTDIYLSPTGLSLIRQGLNGPRPQYPPSQWIDQMSSLQVKQIVGRYVSADIAEEALTNFSKGSYPHGRRAQELRLPPTKAAPAPPAPWQLKLRCSRCWRPRHVEKPTIWGLALLMRPARVALGVPFVCSPLCCCPNVCGNNRHGPLAWWEHATSVAKKTLARSNKNVID